MDLITPSHSGVLTRPNKHSEFPPPGQRAAGADELLLLFMLEGSYISLKNVSDLITFLFPVVDNTELHQIIL